MSRRSGRADDRDVPFGTTTEALMTVTLHIDNTVRDYDDWKAAFDQF